MTDRPVAVIRLIRSRFLTFGAKALDLHNTAFDLEPHFRSASLVKRRVCGGFGNGP